MIHVKKATQKAIASVVVMIEATQRSMLFVAILVQVIRNILSLVNKDSVLKLIES